MPTKNGKEHVEHNVVRCKWKLTEIPKRNYSCLDVTRKIDKWTKTMVNTAGENRLEDGMMTSLI